MYNCNLGNSNIHEEREKAQPEDFLLEMEELDNNWKTIAGESYMMNLRMELVHNLKHCEQQYGRVNITTL